MYQYFFLFLAQRIWTRVEWDTGELAPELGIQPGITTERWVYIFN